MEEKAGVQGRAEMRCGEVRPGEKVACHQPAHCEGASRAETGRKSDLDLQQLSGLTREPAEERGCEVRSNGLTGPEQEDCWSFSACAQRGAPRSLSACPALCSLEGPPARKEQEQESTPEVPFTKLHSAGTLQERAHSSSQQPQVGRAPPPSAKSLLRSRSDQEASSKLTMSCCCS